MEINILEIVGVDTIRRAAVMPYQSQTEDSEKLAYKVWKAGHRSIARHSIITIEILGISQDALRQLSRHPHINLTVKSTRYCDFTDTDLFIPKGIDKALRHEYVEDFEAIMDIYRKHKKNETEHGIKDVAKQFLPLCSTTDLIMSANVQAMYEFLQLRNCVRVSEEMRMLSLGITTMLGRQNGLIGKIFYDLDCKGAENGICPEIDKCGKW